MRRSEVRRLTVTLREDVTATQPIEGDYAASKCQSGISMLGRTVRIQLPGKVGEDEDTVFSEGPKTERRQCLLRPPTLRRQAIFY